MNFELLEKLKEQTKEMTAFELLSYLINKESKDLAFATSLGIEDQVITEMISSLDSSIRIFVLDTGRFFPETYDLIERTNSRFNVKIEIFSQMLKVLKIWLTKKE